MSEIFNENGATLVIVPKSILDEITSSLTEMKQLIRDKAKQEIGREWMESDEARKMLGVSSKTWQTYRDSRVIPFSQFGRKIYVKRTDIDAFLQSHRIN